MALIVFGTIGAVALLAGAVWVFAVNRVETPGYVTVLSEGDFEIRDYPPIVVAEVTRTGARKAAVNSGFGALAAYIFARDRAGEKLSMTAPVTQQPIGKIAMTAPVTQTRQDGDEWLVQFIMPAKYQLNDLPAPGGRDVKLREIPAQRRAAVRFSGVADDALIARNEARLREWMSARGLKPLSEPVYAYYNDPFTPGFLRRNEVMFEIAR
jgi:SOUL heme-binding protein.